MQLLTFLRFHAGCSAFSDTILQVRRVGTSGALMIQVARHPLLLVVALHCTLQMPLLDTRCNKHPYAYFLTQAFLCLYPQHGHSVVLLDSSADAQVTNIHECTIA